MTETDYIHPLVAEWLTQNGYTYQHEVTLPNGGRADFVAVDRFGQQIVVECKVDGGIRSSIRQLRDYAEQLEANVQRYLAMPRCNITKGTRESCIENDVKLIELNISQDELMFYKIHQQKYDKLCMAFGMWQFFIEGLGLSHPNPSGLLENALDDYITSVMPALMRCGKYYVDARAFAVHDIFNAFRQRLNHSEIDNYLAGLLETFAHCVVCPLL